MNNQENKDYEVGYGRPPKEHQFKSGKSGNSTGRPKMVKDFKTDLADELEEVITVNEFGKAKHITKQKAFIKKLVAGALNGNTNSSRILTQLIANYAKESVDKEPEELSIDDKAILELFMERSKNNG